MPTQAKTNHGGVRTGAGRKPKALRYASELASAEGKLMAALPGVVDSLVLAAQAGDVGAAKYLLDRAFGRIAPQATPPAFDRELPYTDEDAELAQEWHEEQTINSRRELVRIQTPRLIEIARLEEQWRKVREETDAVFAEMGDEADDDEAL